MNKEELEDYKKLSGEITDKLDNTATYESWLIIQEYVDRCQEKNQKYKEAIDKAIDLIEKSVTTDIGIDSNNNLIHYHQLTEDETGELLDILKEVE